jgi:serine/threonine protein kinase
MFGGQVIGPSGPFGRVPSAPALRGGSLDLALVPDGALMVQPLAPGTLLKGGRYRLIQRFHALETAERQDGDPPLMIASDTELPNGRVLVQELRLNAARPEDTETARRLVAQRMLTLGRHPGMPKLLDHFSERRRHFLVFELPSGDVLSERLLRTRGPVDEVTAIGYALRILDALAALEQVTPVAVHGNLSPANPDTPRRNRPAARPARAPICIRCAPCCTISSPASPPRRARPRCTSRRGA